MSTTPLSPDLAVFEAERPRLTGLAYRITGTLADAEDVVQEAWMRWAGADIAEMTNPAGWLTTVASRLAIDRLRLQRRRREVYVGPWLPDPAPTEATMAERAGAVEMAESLTVAFMMLLESLGPSERVAFLLGEVFGEPYPVIAEVLGKTEPACRQLVSRARRKMRSARPQPKRVASRSGSGASSVELLLQLVDAVLDDDEYRALTLLHPDVTLVSDGGPNRRAARRPVVGAQRVRQLLRGGWRLFGLSARPSREAFGSGRLLDLNSSPSLVLDSPQGPVVINADILDGRISHIWVRLNPSKTTSLDHSPII